MPTNNETEIADLEKLYQNMKDTPRNSGYEFCDICGRYDEDAGGIDYWIWEGKNYCYGGCWINLLKDTQDKLSLLIKQK